MARKPRKIRIKPPRPLTEKAALTQVVESWQRSSKFIHMTESEQSTVLSVILKCEHRLKEIDAERKNTSAEADACVKKYEAYRKAQIQAGHKVSGYSNWIRIAPGSYGHPKG